MTGQHVRAWPPRLVSVVVPARNVESVLPEQLAALGRQSYTGRFDVVVVDNGSTDRTAELVTRWQAEHPSVRLVAAPDGRGVSYARNAGVLASEGELVAFCDADDVVGDHWLSALVEVSRSADIVAGYLDGELLNSPTAAAWRGELPRNRAMTAMDWMPFAPGGNCAVWRGVVEALDGWSDAFVGGSDDVDFCWRAQLAGFQVGFAPDAVLSYRFRDGLRPLLRQFYQYGRTEGLLAHRYASHGLPLPSPRAVLRRWLTLLSRAPQVGRGVVPRGVWLREVAYATGRLRGGLDHGRLLS